MTTSRPKGLDPAELADPWARHARPEQWHACLRDLRELGRPARVPGYRVPFLSRGGGHYALVTHADVAAASRNAKVFASAPSAVVPTPPSFVRRYVGEMMIDMDDPRHARIRRIVSRAFTPRTLARLEEQVEATAARLVADLARSGPGDFVEAVAAALPTRIICGMMGIPDEQVPTAQRLATRLIGLFDPDLVAIPRDRRVPGTAAALARAVRDSRGLHLLGMALARERAARPADDLTTLLVTADIDGERLTPAELGSFFTLLLVAGSETTRNAIAHGLRLFTENPGQRDLLTEDLDGRIKGAVEEVLRRSSPVLAFRRTVAAEHTLGGHTFRPGDVVMLYYSSANHDETVFTDPLAFDITRSPNPHLAFGGPGPHYCLGAHLARKELQAVFRELFTRLPGIRAGTPDRLVSPLIDGIKHLPCTF